MTERRNVMLRECLEIVELLSDPAASGSEVAALFPAGTLLTRTPIDTPGDTFDFILVEFPGHAGKLAGGDAPTLGLLGQLGGLRVPGSRVLHLKPMAPLLLSPLALRMARQREAGELFAGDVIVTTHVCQQAVLEPREPYPFVMPPVPFRRLLDHHINPAMDAILTTETARGNRFVCHKGFAITQPVKEGMVLPGSPDLLRIMEHVTGAPPVLYPISMQDLTPWDNGVYHSTLLVAPATVCHLPVVGVGLTSAAAPTGYATNVADIADLDAAARFCLAVADQFGAGTCHFYDPKEFEHLSQLYGTPGEKFRWASVD